MPAQPQARHPLSDLSASPRLALKIPGPGKFVTLSAPDKWRRAIQAGDLTPDTLVETDRGGALAGPLAAREVPELVRLFIQEHLLEGPEELATAPPVEAEEPAPDSPEAPPVVAPPPRPTEPPRQASTLPRPQMRPVVWGLAILAVLVVFRLSSCGGKPPEPAATVASAPATPDASNGAAADTAAADAARAADLAAANAAADAAASADAAALSPTTKPATMRPDAAPPTPNPAVSRTVPAAPEPAQDLPPIDPSLRASFPCEQARAWDETMICGYAVLAPADRQMGEAYNALRSQLSGPALATLTTEQRAWLAERRRCRGTSQPVACLYNSTVQRTRVLRSAIARGSGTRPVSSETDRPAAQSQQPRALSSPRWTRRPRPSAIGRYYPREALEARANGQVELRCRALRDGDLACEVISEDPIGMGFGAAAIKTMNSARLSSNQSDGPLQPGDWFVQAVTFRYTDDR